MEIELFSMFTEKHVLVLSEKCSMFKISITKIMTTSVIIFYSIMTQFSNESSRNAKLTSHVYTSNDAHVTYIVCGRITRKVFLR